MHTDNEHRSVTLPFKLNGRDQEESFYSLELQLFKLIVAKIEKNISHCHGKLFIFWKEILLSGLYVTMVTKPPQKPCAKAFLNKSDQRFCPAEVGKELPLFIFLELLRC